MLADLWFVYISFNAIEAIIWFVTGCWLFHKDRHVAPMIATSMLACLLLFGITDLFEAFGSFEVWLWWSKSVTGMFLFVLLSLREHFVSHKMTRQRLVMRTALVMVLFALYLQVYP